MHPPPDRPGFCRRLLLIAVLGGAWPAHGAESFVRVINAVAAPGTLKLTLDRTTFNAEGYPPGSGSGWLGLRPGTFQLQGTHSELGRITAPVRLAAHEAKALIIFLKTQPPKKAGDAPRRVMRYCTLRCQPAPSAKDEPPLRTVTFLLLERTPPLELRAGRDTCTLVAGEPHTLTLPRDSGLHVPVGTVEQPGLLSLNLEEPVNHYVVLYPGADGKLEAVSFQR